MQAGAGRGVDPIIPRWVRAAGLTQDGFWLLPDGPCRGPEIPFLPTPHRTEASSGGSTPPHTQGDTCMAAHYQALCYQNYPFLDLFLGRGLMTLHQACPRLTQSKWPALGDVFSTGQWGQLAAPRNCQA